MVLKNLTIIQEIITALYVIIISSIYITAITSQVVRTAVKKILKTPGGVLISEPDYRGKHDNRPNSYPDEMLNEVRQHIESFPVMESHYCRKDTKKKYLEENLNLSKMYSMYEFDKKEKKEDYVAEQKYCKIFNTEYNYSFFLPKKDGYEY